MILVTGATGNLGAATIEFLRKERPEAAIAALARDPERASRLRAHAVDVRRGDYSDVDSLVAAFTGVDKLLLVSTSALQGVVEQHANAISAATKAGVRHIIFTSVVNAPAISSVKVVREYLQTEELLKRSGLKFTILRNGYYLDMLPMLIGDVAASGQIRYPAGEGRASWAARSDLAEAAATVLASDGHEGRTYELNTNISYSFHDIAAAIGKAVGRPIQYVDIPIEKLRQELQDQQLGPAEVELTVELAQSIRNSEPDHPSADLERLLGRAPTSLAEFARRTYGGAA